MHLWVESCNEIIASVHIEKGACKIKKMPVIIGKLITNIVPSIPILNRIFNSNNFEFLELYHFHYKTRQTLGALKASLFCIHEDI